MSSAGKSKSAGRAKTVQPAKTKLKRYSLTLPESTAERIETIRIHTEASSDSEVIRRAIRLYERLVTGEVTLAANTPLRTSKDGTSSIISDELI